jgi:hypothetical protein
MDIRLTAPGLGFHVDVRLARRGQMWVAVATIAGHPATGIGPSAHAALRASLATLGARTVAVLLADPGLMAVSAEVR